MRLENPPMLRVHLTVGWSRKTPIRLGHDYRPHARMLGDEEYLGVTFEGGPDWLAPGESGEVTMVPMYAGVDYSKLKPGVEFEIMEGFNRVAMGRVLSVGVK